MRGGGRWALRSLDQGVRSGRNHRNNSTGGMSAVVNVTQGSLIAGQWTGRLTQSRHRCGDHPEGMFLQGGHDAMHSARENARMRKKLISECARNLNRLPKTKQAHNYNKVNGDTECDR